MLLAVTADAQGDQIVEFIVTGFAPESQVMDL
jgi:hypothetical protein